MMLQKQSTGSFEPFLAESDEDQKKSGNPLT